MFIYDLDIVYVNVFIYFGHHIVDKNQLIYNRLEAVMFRHDS